MSPGPFTAAGRARLARAGVALSLALCSLSTAGLSIAQFAPVSPKPQAKAEQLADDLDRIFADPVLARALTGIRVESLERHQLLYARSSEKLVIPASNMKIVTLAVAAERLGWDFTYETRLEAAGRVEGGTLKGDLVVIGTGDPTIASVDFGPAPLFAEWAAALHDAGIKRVEGRVIGDDRAFDDQSLGPGWAWDYLADGYAAPTSALNYNENVAVLRAWPGAKPGDQVRIELTPPGHRLDIVNELQTQEGSGTSVDLARLPGSGRLSVRGRVPAGGQVVVRTAAVDNPTRFFVEGLRLALAEKGIAITGEACDIGDVAGGPAPGPRRVIARRTSWPLSAMAGYFMKVSQNFYAETLMKTIGRAAEGDAGVGSIPAGRRAVRETLTTWGVPADSYVAWDGSGLSRYDYVSADAIVAILRHVWEDPKLRGPFVAALPVAARDGTLSSRMKGTVLDTNVEAKTGTISNVRSLSGYLETRAGEKLVFSMIVNHFTASSADVDAVVEKALARIYDK